MDVAYLHKVLEFQVYFLYFYGGHRAGEHVGWCFTSFYVLTNGLEEAAQ